MRGRQLKIAKAWLKEQGNQLSFAPLAKEFIQASQKIGLMVFLQNTGFIVIPLLVASVMILPYLRQRSYYDAWETIRNIKTRKPCRNRVVD
ncbi:hypothetical protein [Fischerella sp. JS2]|uniref:hypothetical protein n=1 Tax=Fischerella sp. JS2 TaxID=2597771 RepID=UPI0028EDEB6D|nr:hypothetical protein [Fischerella sp. JS2]